jgi:hypothetical protein
MGIQSDLVILTLDNLTSALSDTGLRETNLHGLLVLDLDNPTPLLI